MVPADYTLFFSVMAGVGATLFGLIFLVITIKPEIAAPEGASIIWQVQVASAYTSLLNPLVISLFALVPHTTIGSVTLIMGAIGQISTIIMGASLVQESGNWTNKLKSGFFILVSFVIFGLEMVYAVRLIMTPGDVSALDNLTTQLVIIYLYGIARAWDLVGIRKFDITELLTLFVPKRVEQIVSKRSHAERADEANKRID